MDQPRALVLIATAGAACQRQGPMGTESSKDIWGGEMNKLATDGGLAGARNEADRWYRLLREGNRGQPAQGENLRARDGAVDLSQWQLPEAA